MRIYFSLFILLKLSLYNCITYAQDDSCFVGADQLRINQIQTLGSHNSYHQRANKFVLRFLKGLSGLFPKEYNPKQLDYAHEPLAVQLDSFHLRSIEIDIYADPDGGHYYYRKRNNLLGKPKASKIDELKQPGFKVMHIPDIDYNSNFITFKSALTELKNWSETHPSHLPVYILIECKEETIANKISNLHFTKAIPFSEAIMNDVDTEIKSVFGENLYGIITPDMVRDTFPTLREAVLAGNFPSIEAARGKFIFVMMEVGIENYLLHHPYLQGRVMFTFSTPNKPECAFVKYDDALKNEAAIIDAVKKGFIVRTRADEPDHQNRSGNYEQQQAAFRSGAQIISTDYYRPDIRYKKHPKRFTNYSTVMQGNSIARINPVAFPIIKIKE